MTFFPSPRRIIKRISGFSKRLLGIARVSSARTTASPADLPPEVKNREERLKRLKEEKPDRSKFKKKMEEVREVYAEEDEELKDIEEGHHGE